MASTFGWLDQDDAQRKAMLSVVELFKDEGTVDELGIGSVRDFFADSLFPGTSVLLTRARYLVMIPWLLRDTCAASKDPAAGLIHLRQLEGRLIHSLLNGGETDGVIGRQAKEKLKRMPSTAYWAALGHFGVRDPKLTIEGLLRTDIGARRRLSRADTPDDPGAERDAGARSLHPDLPPAPEGLLEAATLTLTTREADFLSEQIRKTTGASLTAWLLEHGVPPEDGYAWEQSALEQLSRIGSRRCWTPAAASTPSCTARPWPTTACSPPRGRTTSSPDLRRPDRRLARGAQAHRAARRLEHRLTCGRSSGTAARRSQDRRRPSSTPGSGRSSSTARRPAARPRPAP